MEGRTAITRPGFLIVQWLVAPDEARRAALLSLTDMARREERQFGAGPGMIAIYSDDDALLVEDADSILTATAQNATASQEELSRLAGATPIAARRRARDMSLRNESLVHIDKLGPTITVLTDPIGFSKVFHLETDDFRLIASSIEPLAALSPGVDLGSVSSFLVNGAPLDRRTVFRGIVSLSRASMYRFTAERSESTTYWSYTPAEKPVDAGTLKALQVALWEAIVAAIEAQCAGKRVLLPLSGGFDSSVILGVLGKILKHPDVTCFSYTNGRAGAGSDAHVAKQQAAVFGYPHLELDISGATLADVLEKNGEAGQLQRGPSLEITAYADLRRLVDGASDGSIMPFGDEFFGGGWSSFSLSRAKDLLGAVYLRSPDGLAPLREHVAPERFAAMQSALDEDYRRIVAEAGDEENWRAARELLYFEQRIAMNLLPLRTFSVGHWFDVCAPLLDTSVIDQIALLPPEQRRDKTFFKDMAHVYLPEIFENTRSSHRQAAPEFTGAGNGAAASLAETARSEGWRIPGVLENQDVISLIHSMAAVDARVSLRGRFEANARKLLSRAGVLERVKNLRYRYASPFDERPDRVTFLARVLSLARQTASLGN